MERNRWFALMLALGLGGQMPVWAAPSVVPDFELQDRIRVPRGEVKYTFRLREVPLREALQMVAEAANLNLVLDASVQGDVSLDFFQVPLDQLLETVLYSRGYRLTPYRDAFLIYRSGQYGKRMVRFVPLRFANAQALLPTLYNLLEVSPPIDFGGVAGAGGGAAGAASGAQAGAASQGSGAGAASAPATSAGSPSSPAAPSGAGGASATSATSGAPATSASAGAATAASTAAAGAAGGAAGIGATPRAGGGNPATGRVTNATAADVQALFGLSIRADSRSNRVILTGTRDRIELAQQMIKQLDVLIPTQVFRLSHISAPQAISVLRASFFEGSGGAGGGAGAGGGQGGGGARSTRVTSTFKSFAQLGGAPTFEQSNVDVSLESPRFIPLPTENALLVMGTAQELELVGSVLKAIDRRRPQVLIKIQVVEISLTEALNLGATLGIGTRQFQLSSGQQGGGLTFNTAADQALNFNAQLSALVQRGRAKVLASPQVLAMDSRQTQINIDDTIASRVTTQQTQNANQTTTSTQVETSQAGVQLTLVPRIDHQGGVALFLQPNIQTPQAPISLGNGSSFTPVSRRQFVGQEIYVKDGQTIVIGGLVKDVKRQSLTKVPLLGDIPFLGGIFQLRDDRIEQAEVQIYVTPEVVKDEAYQS